MSLTADLTATVADDAVELALTVENGSDEQVGLEFSDAQQVDFAAFDDEDGGEVWRWSSGQLFAQMLTSEVVPAGGSVTYTRRWEEPPSGEYEVVGEVPARNVDLEDRTTVTV